MPLLAARPAGAQAAYPSRPIRLVIPFGAGGITDVVGRLLGQGLGQELGQTVVIDNRPGAGGSIAAQAVSGAAPDGHTLLLGTVGTQVVNRMLYRRLAYDPAAFAPVSLMTNAPYVMAVSGLPEVDSLAALADHARAHPDALNFGSAGNGSSPHLGIELFKLATGTSITHVPFRSGAEAVNAALSGQVQIVMDAIAVVEPHARSGGALRALAIADARRNPAMPDLRTSAEAGVPALRIGSWSALLAPGGTPSAVTDALAAALARVLARPGTVERFTALGLAGMPTGREAYATHVQEETVRWSEVIRVAGTQLD
jgi:tripartite-type tricarboxylate transporter receptor subunit TctC